MVAAGPLHAAPRDGMAFRVAERLAWLSELPFDPSEVRREASQLDRRGVDDTDAVPRLLAIIGFHLDVVVGSRATLAEIASHALSRLPSSHRARPRKREAVPSQK